jgi:TatA/E family protein of Tat protein translocase
MPQIGPLEIAVVLLIALLVFGPNRLPELARQVGGALRELRKIQHNLRADLHEMMADESDGAAPPPSLPPKAEDATVRAVTAGDAIDVASVTGNDMAPAEVPELVGEVPEVGDPPATPDASPLPPSDPD